MTIKELEELDSPETAPIVEPVSEVVAPPADTVPVVEPEPKPSKPDFKEIVLASQEDADKFVKDRVARAERSAKKESEDRVRALEAELKGFKDKELSEDQLKEQRLAESAAAESALRDELNEARRELLVTRLAGKASLPEELWDRVRGNDEDEIAADIVKLSGLVPAAGEPSKKPPVHSPTLRVAPTGDDPEPEPDVKNIVDSISGLGLGF